MSTGTGVVNLFIIGGGVDGAGIARGAAGRGMSVVLCEKDDLAQGTSFAFRQARPWRIRGRRRIFWSGAQNMACT